ncbi:MAG TPA: TRAP transporter substrate-binding protein [Thermodesulfobacteriota bacterium]|jgi:TRAP-type C4-dicarboxylate transport system substrate-binding protein|nr:TRAP transporter substrate-binding protein [Thermodesulfobacteriota bacterium]
MGKKAVLLLLVVSFLFSMYSSPYAAEVIKLKFANYFPPTHMNSVMMGKYCDELNKQLAGKVEMTQYTGGTLLSAPKIAAGVATGIADIGLSNLAYTRGRFPVMEIMELPVGFPSAWIAGHVANDFYNKYQPKDFDTYHVLMLSTSPINVVQTLNKPVKTLDDIKGLKLRGTGRLGDTVKALGATPIPIETPDLYDSLKRGVIEGALLPMETLKGFKTGELIKYVTASWRVGSAYCFYVAMNKQKWDSLPGDAKKVMTDFSKDFIERWTVEWNNIDIEGKDFFLKQGGRIENIPEADNPKWIKAVQPVIEDYKKDLVSKGYKAAAIDDWISFVNSRIVYWKAQEKAKNIPTTYQY